MAVPKKDNIFRATEALPFHLSYCAIIYHPETQTVLCHKVWDEVCKKWVYYLMSETAEPDETIFQTLQRGITEEFGIDINLETIEFVGSRNSQMLTENDLQVSKTSIYFIVTCNTQAVNRSSIDREYGSEAVFVPIAELIGLSAKNGLYQNKVDLNESAVLQNAYNCLVN